MPDSVRTVTTNTSPADTLASAEQIKAALEAEGLFVTVGDPYTDHSAHPNPEDVRHRVDLTVSTTAPPAPAPVLEPTLEPEPTPDAVPEVEPDEVPS